MLRKVFSNMKCKSCGNVIPSELLRREAFTCPSCGKTYRRSAKPDSSAPAPRKPEAPAERRPREARSNGAAGMPGWVLPVLACLAVVALIFSGIALFTSTRSAVVKTCGQVTGVKIDGNKYVEIPVEIPEQRNSNYFVAVESSTSAVSYCIVKKTTTGFTIGASNRISEARTPEINWVLMPVNLPAQEPVS